MKTGNKKKLERLFRATATRSFKFQKFEMEFRPVLIHTVSNVSLNFVSAKSR